jgi:hypothetical protein
MASNKVGWCQAAPNALLKASDAKASVPASELGLRPYALFNLVDFRLVVDREIKISMYSKRQFRFFPTWTARCGVAAAVNTQPGFRSFSYKTSLVLIVV